MGEEKRQGRRSHPRLVDEVEIDAVEGDGELAEPVELRLVGSPVVAILPVGGQLPRVGEVGPVLPAAAGDLVRLRGTCLAAGDELDAVGHDIELAGAVPIPLPLVPPQAPVD